MRSQTSSERSPIRHIRPLVVLAAAGSLAVGCGGDAETTDLSDLPRVQQEAGFISEDPAEGVAPFIRTEPHRATDPEHFSSNDCYRANAAVVFDATTVYESTDDPNGPYYGFELKILPENVQEACSGDKDGVVWVTERVIFPEPGSNAG
jgi:hypothetical protein